MTERTPSQRQLDRANAERQRQRDEHQRYAAKVNAERERDNAAKRREREDAERERITARLRRRFLVTGGSEAEFESRKAELTANEMQRRSDDALAAQDARLRRKAARAL